MPLLHQHVPFVVEYEDGRTAFMLIDPFTLSRGDHVARIIAVERQGEGKLPVGQISNVKRITKATRPRR